MKSFDDVQRRGRAVAAVLTALVAIALPVLSVALLTQPSAGEVPTVAPASDVLQADFLSVDRPAVRQPAAEEADSATLLEDWQYTRSRPTRRHFRPQSTFF